MEDRTSQLETTILLQRCVCCGSEVTRIPATYRCLHCDCDFDHRPPRSYAEMEGIQTVRQTPSPEYRAWSEWREQALVERWLWFLFTLGLLMTVSLAIFLP